MIPINPLVIFCGMWIHQFLIEALQTGHGYEKLCLTFCYKQIYILVGT